VTEPASISFSVDLMSWVMGVGGLVVGVVGVVYGIWGHKVGKRALGEQREARYSVLSFEVNSVHLAPASTTGLSVYRGERQVRDPVLSTVVMSLLSGPDVVIPAKVPILRFPSNFMTPEDILEVSFGDEEAQYTQESREFLREMPDGRKVTDVYELDPGVALSFERLLRVGETLEVSVITDGDSTIERVLGLPNVRWQDGEHPIHRPGDVSSQQGQATGSSSTQVLDAEPRVVH
jgi:hypothetical protein